MSVRWPGIISRYPLPSASKPVFQWILYSVVIFLVFLLTRNFLLVPPPPDNDNSNACCVKRENFGFVSDIASSSSSDAHGSGSFFLLELQGALAALQADHFGRISALGAPCAQVRFVIENSCSSN